MEFIGQIIFWVFIGLIIVVAFCDTFSRLLSFLRNSDKLAQIKVVFQGLGFLLIFFAIAISIYFLACQMLPNSKIYYGKDEDGEMFDRRLSVSVIVAIPAMYFLYKCFDTWRSRRK